MVLGHVQSGTGLYSERYWVTFRMVLGYAQNGTGLVSEWQWVTFEIVLGFDHWVAFRMTLLGSVWHVMPACLSVCPSICLFRCVSVCLAVGDGGFDSH